MDEADWIASTDPQAMLALLQNWRQCEQPPKVSDRKLRLFACACYRGVAVEARKILDIDRVTANAEHWAETGSAAPGVRESSNPTDIHDDPFEHARGAADWAQYHRGERRAEDLRQEQAILLREIVGNPWRPVTLSCTSCGGNGDAQGIFPVDCKACCGTGRGPRLTPTVVSLARAAYSERGDDGALDPVRLLVLADALEEAGAPWHSDIVRHLRGWELVDENTHSDNLIWKQTNRPHVRGCWAADCILGKD